METKDEAWQVVSNKYLLRRPWLAVQCDDMFLPSGSYTPEYYVLEYPDWVNTVTTTREERFMFVRQFRPGIGRQLYEPCAGTCEKEDVLPLVSAQHELLEETGYGNDNWREYMVISANPSTHINLAHCFLATDIERVDIQHLGDTEPLIAYLLTFEEVEELLKNGQIIQALHAAPLWGYMAEQEQMK